MNKRYWVMFWDGFGRPKLLSKWTNISDAREEVIRQLKCLEYGYSMIDRKREWVKQYPTINIVRMPENEFVG